MPVRCRTFIRSYLYLE